MSICLRASLAAIMLAVFSVCAQAAGWYDLVHADQARAEPVLNVGELLLDAPAGKYGFIENSYGQLRFENGRIVRMWGVNLAGASCFPTPERARRMVEQFVKYGFNIVRFHHIDTDFEPNGIFKDVAPDAEDRHKKPTGVFSEEQLKRLDYFIWLLKKNGIYVDLNLLSGRKFSEADGVRDARQLMRDYGQAGKPVSMFDPHLIDLQKAFIAGLLNHYNPYTKLRYREDPAIAFLEIANETSLFRYWFAGKLDAGFLRGKESLPEFYQQQLNRLWRKWYLARYPDTVAKSVPDRVPWKTRKLHSDRALVDTIKFYAGVERGYFSTMRDFIKEEVGSGALVSASGHYFSLINLEAQAVTDFTSPHYYWDPVRWTAGRWNKQDFAIGRHSVFDVGSGELRRKTHPVVDIAMSHVAGKPLLVTEWNYWYPNPYAYEMPVVLAAYGALHEWDGAIVYAYMKERHGVPYRGWVDDFLDIHSNPQALVLNAVSSLIFQRGYLRGSSKPLELLLDQAEVLRNVAGWGSVRHVNPNWGVSDESYLRHKIVLSFAEQARLAKKGSGPAPAIVLSDTEELAWDSARRMLVIDAPKVRGGVGFLANQSSDYLQRIGLRSETDGAIMLVSLDDHPLADSDRLLLVCVGETRNSAAQWETPPFNWGEAPVQMREIVATLRLPSESPYRITGLDPQGYPLMSGSKADSVVGAVSCPKNAMWALLEKRAVELHTGKVSS